LTASGRAILAGMNHDQLRALFPPNFAFIQRTGRGPRTGVCARVWGGDRRADVSRQSCPR
jgi:DNA-binding IclR family transcriptional regulator